MALKTLFGMATTTAVSGTSVGTCFGARLRGDSDFVAAAFAGAAFLAAAFAGFALSAAPGAAAAFLVARLRGAASVDAD